MFILGSVACVEADEASPLYCLSAALIRLSNDEMGGNVMWFIALLFALLIARCTCHTKNTHPDFSKPTFCHQHAALTNSLSSLYRCFVPDGTAMLPTATKKNTATAKKWRNYSPCSHLPRPGKREWDQQTINNT